ncbi:MAG: universal stress protein [Cyanothece sp. SIO1E1]|nr:universal stress protein [Cyanothece sp. SIO1E1]
MFRRILVAIDDSSISTEVFEQALALAKATGAELKLLHVLSPYEEGAQPIPQLPSLDDYPFGLSSLSNYPGLRDEILMSYRRKWDEFESECLERLHTYTVKANTAGVKTEFTQDFGIPGRTICNAARNWAAELIVMGSRGRTGLSEMILGSVSNYVTHHSPCSVLIVHAPAEAPAEDLQTDQVEVSLAGDP